MTTIRFYNLLPYRINYVTLKDKLSKVNPQINIERAENGWIFEASGRTHDDDWKKCKILVNTSDTLYKLIEEHNEMDLD